MVLSKLASTIKLYRKPISFIVFFLMLFTAVVVHAQTATTTDSGDSDTSTTTPTDQRRPDRDDDTSPPVISSHGNVTAEATSDDGAVVDYILPTTSDDVDGDGVATCNPETNTLFGLGTTAVVCTATDTAGNEATQLTFNVIVTLMPEEEETATTTPETATSTPETAETATSTPETATSTPETSTGTDAGASGSSGVSDEGDPNAVSSATTTSAELDPSESNRDNSDFENIVSGDGPDPDDESLPTIDASATTTEALALEPKLAIATSTDGTGAKEGSSIFTGSATASTTVRNILNITRSNVDGPGVTNSSRITADTDNIGTVTTSDETFAFTGDNSGDGGEGDAIIHTGIAVSSARALNVVNTNFFNSNGLVLFLDQQNAGGLDLRSADLSYFLDGSVGASPTHLGCTILTCLNSSTLKILNRNEAEVNNNVLVRASTGTNTATSTKEGDIEIQTGNAYASAAVLNLVNTNFINSKYLISEYDNFGDMQGDIVLPNATFFNTFFENGNTLPDFNSSSYIVSNDNNETFIGTTTAHAITGGNIATSTAEGHGEIETGEAYTSSTSYTSANQTYVGGSSVLFVFHVSGTWNGSVKGLPRGLSWRRTDYGIEVFSNGRTLAATSTQGVYNSATFIASSTNKAIVKTDVNVWAETGDNYAITENGTSMISTGDAFATANVVNMVNTNVVNRNFMFGVFNITGDWNGDIAFGSHSPNLNIVSTVDAPSPTTPDTDVTYHFTVANNGDVGAENVILDTTYNKTLLFISSSNALSTDTTTGTRWNLGQLAPGESKTIDAIGHVSAPGLQSGFSMTLPLSATVSSSLRDQDDSDNTKSVSVVVFQPEDENTDTDSEGEGNADNGDRDSRDNRDGTEDATPPSSGGGGSPPPSGGGGGGPPTPSNNGGTNNPAPTGGGGGGGGATVDTRGTWTPDPIVEITKKASALTTTAPSIIDYEVIVRNSKTAGPVHNGILTDSMFDPLGEILYERSWPLGALEPGDEIQLSYSVEFATSTVPGIYTNIARLTGQKNNSVAVYAVDADITEASSTITILPNGLDAEELATSTPQVSDPKINISKYVCEPLLTRNMRQGRGNDPLDVVKLQNFLNGEVDAGLPTTGYFGPLTAAAVKKFQAKYADEVLAPWNLTEPTGLVYTTTRAKINELACNGRPVAGTETKKNDTSDSNTTQGSPVTVTNSRETAPTPRASSNTASAASATSNNDTNKEEKNTGGLLGAIGTFFKLW